MRPIRLELNGFASFRDHTVVDFTDADYFALVGPTGSGKSTILDAITFALYGTAYRWGRDNAVADALAPSANRCTVALTFDVGNQRYQVAREVRRGGGATQLIQQRNVSLVRFADPAVTAPDPDGPPPEVIAGEIKELRTAIEDLLGLDFNEFSHCVVLPQGQFARFLTASGPERNHILLKLLGGLHYGRISKAANALATRAEDAVSIYTQQLETHADATPAAERAAEARMSELNDLVGRVDQLVPQISDAADRTSTAIARAASLRGDAERLQALQAPDGVAELQRNVTAAVDAAVTARQAADTASAALTEASQAAQAGPQRTTVELARDRHAEYGLLTGQRADLVAAADTRTQASERAAAELSETAAAEADARQAAAEADAGRDAAKVEVKRLTTEHTRLTAIRAPAGMRHLTDRVAAAREDAQRAASRASNARQQQSDANTALHAAGEPSRLTEARGDLDALSRTRTQLTDADGHLDAARAAAQDAASSEEAATAAHRQADLQLQQARLKASAATLRPQLRVGHECPVCTQTVTTLPPPLNDARLGGAERAAAEAGRVLANARTQTKQADRAVVDAERVVVTLTERAEQVDRRLAGLLPGRPVGEDRDVDADLALVSEQEESLQALQAAATQAAAARQEAEQDQRTAEEVARLASADLTRATRLLNQQAGSLADLDAPAVDDTDLAAAWQQLEKWAADRAAAVAEQRDQAVALLTEATTRSNDAQQALEQASDRHRQAQSSHTEAVRAATSATAQRDNLLERINRLETLLADAPAAEQIEKLLTECSRLEDAVQTATRDAHTARSKADEAEAEARGWDERARTARSLLTRSRDQLAAFGPPPIDVDDLAAGWETLIGWAGIEARSLAAQAENATTEAETSAADAVKTLATLKQSLADHGVDTTELPETDTGKVTGAGTGTGWHLRLGMAAADRAPRLVAAAVAHARAEKEAISRSLRQAGELRQQIATNREQQQVAAQLGDLTSSRKFQQWLADSARESLVTGASETLRELSAGQFDLTHFKGEFYVIDHADADLTRSVRTLSGGETFQASLALALACRTTWSVWAGRRSWSRSSSTKGSGPSTPRRWRWSPLLWTSYPAATAPSGSSPTSARWPNAYPSASRCVATPAPPPSRESRCDQHTHRHSSWTGHCGRSDAVSR